MFCGRRRVQRRHLRRRGAGDRTTGRRPPLFRGSGVQGPFFCVPVLKPPWRGSGLPHASTSAAARLDIRQARLSPLHTFGSEGSALSTAPQAKDGLATLFQAHGLGDVEDDEVRRPPPALMGPGQAWPGRAETKATVPRPSAQAASSRYRAPRW